MMVQVFQMIVLVVYEDLVDVSYFRNPLSHHLVPPYISDVFFSNKNFLSFRVLTVFLLFLKLKTWLSAPLPWQ